MKFGGKGAHAKGWGKWQHYALEAPGWRIHRKGKGGKGCVVRSPLSIGWFVEIRIYYFVGKIIILTNKFGAIPSPEFGSRNYYLEPIIIFFGQIFVM